MSTNDIIILVIGVGTIMVGISALIVSILALITSKRYNNLVKSQLTMQQEYNQLIQAQVEMQISSNITRARTRYEDLILANDDNKTELYLSVLHSAKEEFANAYNEACEKFLDGKVDEIRFTKSYKDTNELRDIVDDTAFKDFYSSMQSKYPATVKVYKDWYHTE